MASTKKLTHFGHEMRLLMQQAGYKSREEFVRAAGLSAMTLWRWETNDQQPIKEPLLQRAAQALRVSPQQLRDLRALSQKISAGSGTLPVVHPMPRLIDEEQQLQLLRKLDASWAVRAGWGIYIHSGKSRFQDITEAFLIGFVHELSRTTNGSVPDDDHINEGLNAGREADLEAKRVAMGADFLPPVSSRPTRGRQRQERSGR